MKHRYDVNDNFFESIDSEEKAYFLGLMASDGCITNGNKLLIGLAREDGYILEKFKTAIEYEGPVYEIDGRTEKHKDQSRLQIRNSKIFSSLINLGIVERKSLILTFPSEEQIPKHLQSHFIRGYFDGDGSTKLAKGVLYFRLVGTFEFLDELQNILIENCDVEKIKMYQANKSKNTFELTYGGDKQCTRIYDYMYKNANLFLTRKKEKARQQISSRLQNYSTWILQEELKNRK